MSFNPKIHHRRSIRLKNYDYSQAGAYFVTICTQGRDCLFGEIENSEMQLSLAGQAVAVCWPNLPRHFDNIELDEFVVMPNHVHGIVVIVGAKHSKENPKELPDTAPNASPLLLFTRRHSKFQIDFHSQN